MSRNIEHSIKDLADNITKLQAENGLLRAASEQQRELNGELRQTIQASDDSTIALAAWCHWFKTYGSLINGTAYTEGSNLTIQSRKIILQHPDYTER